MALDDDDMTTPPTGADSSEPADPFAEAPIGADELSGQDGGAGSGSGADRPTDGSGAGADDPTTEADEDTRFA